MTDTMPRNYFNAQREFNAINESWTFMKVNLKLRNCIRQ
jgi:hypothetical protein